MLLVYLNCSRQVNHNSIVRLAGLVTHFNISVWLICKLLEVGDSHCCLVFMVFKGIF